MKRIKTVNGYAIYQAVTARDEENYGCQIGSYNLYLSSDIKDYGLSYSSPMFDNIDSLASAIELANGSNYAQAEALAWELSDSTCQDMDLTLEIERRLDAGETVEAIREAYDTEEQRFVDPSTPEEPEREEIPYLQILEERIASLNARIDDCRDDDERIALYQTREDLEEELRFAWAELEEEASKPADLWTVDAFLHECEELCRNPFGYDFNRMPAGTCNGHEVQPYPRSLAAIIVDGGIVNMGVINERYPRGSVGFFVNNKGMTGIEYVRYLLEK